MPSQETLKKKGYATLIDVEKIEELVNNLQDTLDELATYEILPEKVYRVLNVFGSEETLDKLVYIAPADCAEEIVEIFGKFTGPVEIPESLKDLVYEIPAMFLKAVPKPKP